MGKIKFIPISSQVDNFYLISYSVILKFADSKFVKVAIRRNFCGTTRYSDFFTHTLGNQNFLEQISVNIGTKVR